MIENLSKKRYWSYLGITLLCAITAIIPFQGEIGPVITSMLKVTLTVYAMARGLNGVISVAQGTEVSVEPLGVGLTLAPGQILDPLNDLVEQFSSVLLLASASLGIQKIVLLLGDIHLVRIVLLGLSVISIVCILLRSISAKNKQRFTTLVVILTLLRCAVPIVALVSQQLQHVLKDQREQAMSVLVDTQQQVARLNAETDKDQSWYQGLKHKLDINATITAIQNKTETAIEAAIYLLAEFVLVMVLVPIGFIFLIIRLLPRLRIN